MRHHRHLVLLGLLPTAILTSEAPRSRGVGPEYAKYYKTPSDTFSCITDPAIKLPLSRLNDDYCDCPDGSDEPGTSACAAISALSPPSPPLNGGAANANATLALPGFYCKNKGHRPAYVPFANVNDGVCDYDLCCDGSDEWAGVGGVVCADRCKEMGKAWRAAEEARVKARSQAARKRREMVGVAAAARKRMEDEVAVLEGEVQVAEGRVAELEAQLGEVERRESGKVVRGGGMKGKVGVLAGLARERVEELRDGLVRVRAQRDAVRERLRKLEGILETFKDEYNPNFNDEGVKRAVRSWEEYAAARKQDGDPDAASGADAIERDLDEISKPDGQDGGINWEEWAGGDGEDEESDVDILYNLNAYLPTPVRTWLSSKAQSVRDYLVANGILAASPPADTAPTESKAVTDARNAVSSAKSSLSTLESRLASTHSDLERDYGPDDILLALKGSCIETDSGEYTYKLCWLDRTVQKGKKGGVETSMGAFARIETVAADDEDEDGMGGVGAGNGSRLALKFENGQHCWNGPSRSTLVVLHCAATDEITRVVEEEKCVYRMEVGSPAGCEAEQLRTGADGAGAKDEL